MNLRDMDSHDLAVVYAGGDLKRSDRRRVENILFERFQPLFKSQAYKFRFTGLDIDDLLGVIYGAFTTSLKKFDPVTYPDKKFPAWLKRGVSDAMLVEVPVMLGFDGATLKDLFYNYTKYEKACLQVNPEATSDDIVEYMAQQLVRPRGNSGYQIVKTSETAREFVLQYREMRRGMVSLDKPLGEDGAVSLADFVVDEGAPDPLDELNTWEQRKYCKIFYEAALNELDERYRRIFTDRMLAHTSDESVTGTEFSLAAIGQREKISKERVRQIEEKARKRVKKHMRLLAREEGYRELLDCPLDQG